MSRVRSQGFVSRLAWWQGVWRALASLHSLGFDDEPENCSHNVVCYHLIEYPESLAIFWQLISSGNCRSKT